MTDGRLVLAGLVVVSMVSTGLLASNAPADDCGPALSITFDDGYRSVHAEAFPVLEDLGVRATTYAITGQVGGGFEDRPLMTWEQLRELQDAGWEVGSHSRTHPDLRNVSDEQLQDEVVGSRQDLIDHGITPATMAAPYGHTNDRVREAVLEEYDAFRVTEWGANDRSDPDPGALNAYWLNDKIGWTDVEDELVNGTLEQGWGILMLHSVDASSDYAYSIDPETLRDVVRTARDNGIDIKPVAAVLEEGC